MYVWSQGIEKGSMGSCSGTGKSQVVSFYSTVAASSDPQRIHKGFLPAQPQQHHCYDMELHKSSHLELVTLITTCSLESRQAPLTPAHLWLQSTVCSSSNPYMQAAGLELLPGSDQDVYSHQH